MPPELTDHEHCVAIARGCLNDYLGGYDGRDLEIYRHGMATVLRALLAPYDHRTRALVAAPAASERPSEWAIVMAAEYVNAEKDGTHIGAVVDLAKMFDRALFSTLQPETPDA